MKNTVKKKTVRTISLALIVLTLAFMFTACGPKEQPPEIPEGYQRIERDGFSFCIPEAWSTFSAVSQVEVAYKDNSTDSNLNVVKTFSTIKIKEYTKELLESQFKTAGMNVSGLNVSLEKLNKKDVAVITYTYSGMTFKQVAFDKGLSQYTLTFTKSASDTSDQITKISATLFIG